MDADRAKEGVTSGADRIWRWVLLFTTGETISILTHYSVVLFIQTRIRSRWVIGLFHNLIRLWKRAVFVIRLTHIHTGTFQKWCFEKFRSLPMVTMCVCQSLRLCHDEWIWPKQETTINPSSQPLEYDLVVSFGSQPHSWLWAAAEPSRPVNVPFHQPASSLLKSRFTSARALFVSMLCF